VTTRCLFAASSPATVVDWDRLHWWWLLFDSRRSCETAISKPTCDAVPMSAATDVTTCASGIDLGASAIWVVRIEGRGRPYVTVVERLPAAALARVEELVSASACVAIDAPEGLSAGSHLGDQRIAAKFRSARCSEVALRRAGIAVPFVTPLATEDVPPWMAVGFSVWEIARGESRNVVETYPHGIFWRLARHQLFHKQREVGRAARRAVLEEHIDLPVGVELWGHDALDAVACAWLAWSVAHNFANRIDCAEDLEWPQHDGSSIWLPAMGSPMPGSKDARPN
jgi:predicted nuclease with RNAse H fold